MNEMEIFFFETQEMISQILEKCQLFSNDFLFFFFGDNCVCVCMGDYHFLMIHTHTHGVFFSLKI